MLIISHNGMQKLGPRSFRISIGMSFLVIGLFLKLSKIPITGHTMVKHRQKSQVLVGVPIIIE